MASLFRILTLLAVIFAAYKAYPHFAPEIAKIKENPQVLGETITGPVLGTVNSVLPSYLQIKTKSNNPTDSATDSSTPTNPIVNNEIFTSIKDKASQLANEQVDALKKEAGKQFCAILLERVRQECNPNP